MCGQSPRYPIGGGSMPICQSSALISPLWWISSSTTWIRMSSAVTFRVLPLSLSGYVSWSFWFDSDLR